MFVLISLFALALAACAGAPVPSLPAATLQPQPSPQPFSLDYTRSGGFIGYRDHLVISANGHAVLMRRIAKFEFDLDSASLRQIGDVFQTAGFAAISENSMPRAIPADGIAYVVVYQGHQVRTADTAIPEKIAPVLSLLNGIIDSRGK